MGLGTHRHHNGCYARVLKCGFAAHQHNTSCYTLKGTRRYGPDCGKVHHVHVDSCWETQKVCSQL
jgi:hypothetical protein